MEKPTTLSEANKYIAENIAEIQKIFGKITSIADEFGIEVKFDGPTDSEGMAGLYQPYFAASTSCSWETSASGGYWEPEEI